MGNIFGSAILGNPKAETQRLCLDSLKSIKLGLDPESQQNGKDFYKYFFTNYPDLRKYFKGAEHYTAEDVQKSERFAKQGQRLLIAVHTAVNLYLNEMVFENYIRETVNRHKQFKMDISLWDAFWTVWEGFLKTKTKMDDVTKQAWAEFGKDFAAIAIDHAKKIEKGSSPL